MKKPIYLLTGLFTVVCLVSCLFSCRDMSDVYKEFIVKGGLKYPQKADSLKVYPGYNRLRMTWLKAMDPGVVRAEIYWNNYLDTMRIDLTDTQDGVVTVDLNDLVEGNYTFYVKTFDSSGNVSLTVEASGYTYGENYMNRLVDRSIIDASRDDSGVCTIEWDVKTPDLLYTQVTYRTTAGEEATINVMPDDVSTVCDNIEPGGSAEYRSVYLPAEGIDEVALSWNRLLFISGVEIKTKLDPKTNLYGVVTDVDGNYIPGVVVSDGYSCSATDDNGVYQLVKSDFARQVYISIPEQYEVPIYNGHPDFWQEINRGSRYDFMLNELPGGVENDFRLFCIADPQCRTVEHIDRFTYETIPDVASAVRNSGMPCYGITLGDIIWNSATKDVTPLLSQMKAAMSQSNTLMPLFQITGNHDNAVIKGSYSVTHDIEAQRDFESCFGPLNYSFNRGNVHIVGMDNVIFTDHDNYVCGFRDDQVEWLKQDLANVPKTKHVILCVHIPLRNRASYKNAQTVINMLTGYASVHIMEGHTHYAENNIYTNKNGMYEHVHAAACGAWWYSTINVDGTPNGYGIYDISADGIVKWKYKGTRLDENFQIRLYRGSEIFPGDFTFEYKDANQIVANVWNADKNWQIDVYENGTKTGSMLPFATSVKRDAWAVGYHRGVAKRTGSDYDFKSNSHLYYYTLNDVGATVEVRATDPFGQIFTQKIFTGSGAADYPSGY